MFAIDGDLDTLGIGQIEHEFVEASEAVGILGIADRLSVIETVNVGPLHAGVGLTKPGLIMAATGPDVAIAERKQRLAQQIGVGFPASFDQSARDR